MGSDLYLWEEESRVHVNVKVAPATQQLVLVIVLRRRRRRGGARPTITVYDAQWHTEGGLEVLPPERDWDWGCNGNSRENLEV